MRSNSSPVEFSPREGDVWGDEETEPTAKKGAKNTPCRRFVSHKVVNGEGCVQL